MFQIWIIRRWNRYCWGRARIFTRFGFCPIHSIFLQSEIHPIILQAEIHSIFLQSEIRVFSETGSSFLKSKNKFLFLIIYLLIFIFYSHRLIFFRKLLKKKIIWFYFNFKRNWKLATVSKSNILISLEPDIADLWYFKLTVK